MRAVLAYAAAVILAEVEYVLGWGVGAGLGAWLTGQDVALWLALIPAVTAGAPERPVR